MRLLMGTTSQRKLRSYCSFWLVLTILMIDCFALLEHGIWRASETQAATGDFSVFREATGTEVIAGAGNDVTWDTTVSANANIALQVNTSDIDLADGGKYLVLYNAWTEQGGEGGANRRSLNSYLTVNGTASAYGWGAGYFRDSESDLTAYNSGAAILDVTAGDDVAVVLDRTDSNAGGGTAIRPGTNGVSILKLDDTLDYLRVNQSTNSADISGNTAFTATTFDTADEVDTDSFGFTAGGSAVTLKGAIDQMFIVTFNVRLDSGSTNRQNYEARLLLGGGEVDGTRTTTYWAGSNGTQSGTLQYVGIVKKTSASDQTLTLDVRRESSTSGTTNIVGGETAMALVAIPETAEVLSVTNNGTQALTSAQSAFNWNQQIATAPTYFTHDTVTNNNQVSVAQDGDYLFFGSTYTSRTSGKGRDVPRIEWVLDSTVQSYGGHGAYNRGSQGGTAYTAGGASALLFPGMTTGEVVELYHSDETTGTPDASFAANRVALQGVEVSTLVPPVVTVDVNVSMNGAQIATTAPAMADLVVSEQLAIVENSLARNVTSVRFTEAGTVDATTGLDNIRLFYELDTTFPYDCLSESYSGAEAQFGASSTFSGANGTVVFSDSVSISPTQAFCGYVVADVTDSAIDSETIDLYMADPSLDVVLTGSPSIDPVIPIGTTLTTVVDTELTQTHYHWRNDDGNEAAATSASGGAEDTAVNDLSVGLTRRLRVAITAPGSGFGVEQFRLEYSEKVNSCADVSAWTDVGDVGGAWDMSDSTFLAEGANTTNVSVAIGGVSDSALTFLSTNGGVRDASSETDPLNVSAGDLVELEYSVEPTASAVGGVGYCFRVTDAGAALRQYDVYPEAALLAGIVVDGVGNFAATAVSGTDDAYIGGSFSAVNNSGSFTVTEVIVTETGTVDAAAYLGNPRLFYESDTSAPLDCASESYSGTESQAAGSAFLDANGTTTFTLSSPISVTEAFCAYVVVDISSTTPDGETVAFEISNPSSQVTIVGASVGPGSVVSPAGSTVINAPALSQVNYHWRTDGANESTAPSASGGVENTGIIDVFQGTNRRLRVSVANDGSATKSAASLRLEYGSKVTTCANVGVWQRVDDGVAFEMASTSQLVDGSDTTNIAVSGGGVTDSAGTFLSPNGAQEELSDQAASFALSTTEFVELEYAIQATDASSFGATYCFRLTDAGQAFGTYVNYPELTVQERQDFFVQRGIETVSGTGLTLTAGIDYTAPASTDSAFVRITNTQLTGAGSDTLGATQNADDLYAYITGPVDLTTGFTITRPPTAADNTRVSWEIVEFIGIAGSDNEFIVRDADEVIYGGASLTASGSTVPGVVNDADVVVFITGQYNPDAANKNFNTGMSISSWNAATDVPVFDRGDADGVAAGVSYAVVEFTGANWNVQRVEHTYTAAGTVETETISAVNALTRTFLHTQKLAGDELDNVDENGHEVWLSSIGAVSFLLEPGSSVPADQRSVAWVIENTQLGAGALKVYRTADTILATNVQPTSYLYPIGATVSPSNASIWANNRSSGSGNAHPRGILGARIFDETQFELWKSDEREDQSFRVEVVEWPVAETSIRQTHFRLYVDNDTLTPTDPWPPGPSDLGENTAMTDLDEPLGLGERTRIRTGLFINNASLIAESASFKLQYGRRVTTCSAVSVWGDVGSPGSSAIWRGFDASPADNATLPSGLLSVTNELGTYEEDSPSASNPATVEIGDYVEYDWNVEHNAAFQKSSYCFRMVHSDGEEIDGYDIYPIIRTTGYTPVIVNWRWYDDETNATPATALAAEQTAPIDIVASNTVKLRVAVTEVEGAPGEDIKFNLEYSQWSDFRDGGTTLTSTTSCVGLTRTWCYQDGAGIDNQTLDSTVLSGVDACVSGVGDGCGTHNEAESLIGFYQQPVFTTSEHEFTLLHNSVGFDQVYYFRMVDATNGVPLVASTSYPSLTTEGAALTFSISGLNAGSVYEGVTLDSTTTATDVGFGTLPFNSQVEAGQRLTVYTNGTEGYRVYLQADQQLTSQNGEELNSVTGTNAVPSDWNTGCVGAASSCFGYHVGDNILYDGSVRFALDDSYAALNTTTPVEVMASGVPVTFDTSEIIYRTEVSESQPAGDYITTLRYIVVPVF